MKSVSFLLIIATFSFTDINSQELSCLNYQLYAADYDVVEVSDHSTEDKLVPSATNTNSVTLMVYPDSFASFPKYSHYQNLGISNGLKVVLSNLTTKEVNLSHRSGKIIMTRQALVNNKWVDVKSYDRTPKRVCGTSRMTERTIKANRSLLFALACIEGTIKTQFRLVVHLKDQRKAIYSNIFDGYVSRELIY